MAGPRQQNACVTSMIACVIVMFAGEICRAQQLPDGSGQLVLEHSGDEERTDGPVFRYEPAEPYAGDVYHPHEPLYQNDHCPDCDYGAIECFPEDEPCCRLSEFNVYSTFSYLENLSATLVEFEFATHHELGFLEAENRFVMSVADLPGAIKLGPSNPSTDKPTEIGVRTAGMGDTVNGTFFSPRGASEQPVHLGIGPVWTLPTASDQILGSGKWTVGPGAHFSAEMGRLTTGFFIWQSWSFAGDSSRSRVNQMFGKPFLIYEMSENWNLIFIPLGMSANWEKRRTDRFSVPLGGGLRHLCEFHGQKMGIQAQAFKYVERKPEDPDWELRFTFEFLFDD